MSTLALDRIQSSLSRLKLSRIGDILEETIKTSEKEGKSYLSFLEELLQEEVMHKEQRRVETALKISGLPFIKSIDEFDFSFQPKLDRRKVMSLFDLTFIREKGNVIFLGPPGVGKTHLAVALALKACQSGMSIYFTNMEDLMEKTRTFTILTVSMFARVTVNSFPTLAVNRFPTPLRNDLNLLA